MEIITQQKTCSVTDLPYWIAYVEGFEDNYSIGDSEEEAIGYLQEAIDSRSDIYGEER